MKFKILDVKEVSGGLQVTITHRYCQKGSKEVFGLPGHLAEDNKYVEWIKDELKKRKYGKVKIDKKMIGKEITL